MTKRTLAVFFAISLALTPCLGEDSTPSEKMIDLGSHRLQVHREGSGTPAVVIDSGHADQLDKLQGLQELLARVTLVITYNRAGYGRSEPGPLNGRATTTADS